jgi:cell wall-associated NlpC family hydrolase
MRHIENFPNIVDTTNLEGIPYKHLGTDKDGIDCFNLGVLLYKEILNIIIPYTTADFPTADKDVNWFNKVENPTLLYDCFTEKYGWKLVEKAKPFDVILMSIGSTNYANHCGVLLPNANMLHTMMGHRSHQIRYGNIFRQATVRIGRWDLDYERNF